MEETKKQLRYPQKFRQAWKKDPKLKDWIRKGEGNSNKSYCIYCKCDLISKYCDLSKHATTKKHLRAAVAAQQQQLTDSLPMMKFMTNDIEQKIEYAASQIETEPDVEIKAEKSELIKKERKTKPITYGEEVSIEYNEQADASDSADDDEDAELTEILSLADNEFEAMATATLQEKKLKAEIEYLQQKTKYFAKLAENTKIHKTLMTLQARKLSLEIKQMQSEYL